MTAGRGIIQLSVVIPAHNSSTVIDECIARVARRLAGQTAEIIVVENGSEDDTFDRCSRLARQWTDPDLALIVRRSEKGMGNALREGARASHGRVVLLTADDLPFGFDDLDAADRLAAEGDGHLPPMLIGSKAHARSEVERGRLRTMLTWGFTRLRRLILSMRTGDPQGTILVDGVLLRCLAEEVLEPGFLFSTELVYLAERLGIHPLEVPVRLSADHATHESRVSPADVVSMGFGLFRLRRRHRRLDRRGHPVAAPAQLQEGASADAAEAHTDSRPCWPTPSDNES